jgi:hypothetical protein
MSEEQSGFKVTDRRLFNPDGTPREVERQAPAEQPAGSAEAVTRDASSADTGRAADTSSAPATAQEGAGQPQEQRRASEDERASVGSGGGGGARAARETHAARDEEDHAEQGIPGADDPASFINFLMSIASNAAASLGMMEHPVTGERGVDLQLAKHWIDVLGMLQEKTRGNLSTQERQILEGLLSDLRMQYVSLNTAPSTQKRGFTGRDIIGGK